MRQSAQGHPLFLSVAGEAPVALLSFLFFVSSWETAWPFALVCASAPGLDCLRARLSAIAPTPFFRVCGALHPVVIGTCIFGHLRTLGRDVEEALPARPCDASLVADSCAARPRVCRPSSAARSIARVGGHRNTSDVQQPPPIWMLRVLHAGCVQLDSWYERPTQGVPLYVEERIDGFRRLQVVHVAVLEKIWFSGGFL